MHSGQNLDCTSRWEALVGFGPVAPLAATAALVYGFAVVDARARCSVSIQQRNLRFVKCFHEKHVPTPAETLTVKDGLGVFISDAAKSNFVKPRTRQNFRMGRQDRTRGSPRGSSLTIIGCVAICKRRKLRRYKKIQEGAREWRGPEAVQEAQRQIQEGARE